MFNLDKEIKKALEGEHREALRAKRKIIMAAAREKDELKQKKLKRIYRRLKP